MGRMCLILSLSLSAAVVPSRFLFLVGQIAVGFLVISGVRILCIAQEADELEDF